MNETHMSLLNRLRALVVDVPADIESLTASVSRITFETLERIEVTATHIVAYLGGEVHRIEHGLGLANDPPADPPAVTDPPAIPQPSPADPPAFPTEPVAIPAPTATPDTTTEPAA